MRGCLTTLWTAKAGSSALEYEDAAASHPPPGVFETGRLRVAVADGASESLLARQWAGLLVERFVGAKPSVGLPAVVDAAIDGWEGYLAGYRAERERVGRPIAWYEEPGLERGAYATAVAARFVDRATDPPGGGQVQIWALGDACLFQVRDDKLVLAFPLDDPDAFGTSPDLVPSRPLNRSLVTARMRHLHADWRSGDLFFLATDALAHWFLAEAALDGAPWIVLRELDADGTPSTFTRWVEQSRADGSLGNDDTTLLRIEIH